MANRIKGIIVEIGGDTTKQLQNGEISQEQYDALQREIAETEVFNNSRCHTINRYFVQDCVVWEVLVSERFLVKLHWKIFIYFIFLQRKE